jgi:hypothetical protein
LDARIVYGTPGTAAACVAGPLAGVTA